MCAIASINLEKYQKVFLSMYDLELVTDLPLLFFYSDDISSYCWPKFHFLASICFTRLQSIETGQKFTLPVPASVKTSPESGSPRNIYGDISRKKGSINEMLLTSAAYKSLQNLWIA